MGCYSLMKFLFVFFNIIYLIIGLAGVGAVSWILLDSTTLLRFTQEENDFRVAAAIYLIIAILLVLLSILGIFSVFKELRWAVVVSFSLLLIVIVVEVASGVWIWVNRDNLDEFTHSTMKRTIQEVYDHDNNMKEMLDTIQAKMQCCGADGASDWARIKGINMKIGSKPTEYNIPSSCCRENIAKTQCVAVTENVKIGENPNYDVIYDKGCYTLIKERILNSIIIIFSVFGSIVGIKIFGLLIGLILAFSMNRSNRYKT